MVCSRSPRSVIMTIYKTLVDTINNPVRWLHFRRAGAKKTVKLARYSCKVVGFKSKYLLLWLGESQLMQLLKNNAILYNTLIGFPSNFICVVRPTNANLCSLFGRPCHKLAKGWHCKNFASALLCLLKSLLRKRVCEEFNLTISGIAIYTALSAIFCHFSVDLLQELAIAAQSTIVYTSTLMTIKINKHTCKWTFSSKLSANSTSPHPGSYRHAFHCLEESQLATLDNGFAYVHCTLSFDVTLVGL